MTFKEIFITAEAEQAQKEAQEASEFDIRQTQLLSYFNDFFHFFQIANQYKLKNSPFVSEDLKQFEKKMKNQITNKGFASLIVRLKNNIVLEIIFFNTSVPSIRVKLKTENGNSNTEFSDQQEAAMYLAKIIVNYKD